MVHVENLSEPKFEESMIDGLVMDPGRKHTIMSLSKSYARRDKRGEELKKSMWSADFIKNKGGGLIFLLHGRPGVGKTCTAGNYFLSCVLIHCFGYVSSANRWFFVPQRQNVSQPSHDDL